MTNQYDYQLDRIAKKLDRIATLLEKVAEVADKKASEGCGCVDKTICALKEPT